MSSRTADCAPQEILLHICCGPCACGAVSFWQNRGAGVLGFFFNPNIHPFLEFRRRLTAASEAAHHARISLAVDDRYDPQGWFADVTSGGGTRCQNCIALRLERTAREAASRGYTAFSTSLAISPWQDHQAITTKGEEFGRQHGVRFVYEDLRPYYGASRRDSRALGLYQQQYCGCLVSESERYRARV
jgi:predicted adenine nucleotide alpha hydrolase (AANH) superfamily ATPase